MYNNKFRLFYVEKGHKILISTIEFATLLNNENCPILNNNQFHSQEGN